MMTIIRPTWNLLRQEDLLTHRELNTRLRILISTCSRNRMFPRPSLLSAFSDPAGYASSVTAECAADAIHERAS